MPTIALRQLRRICLWAGVLGLLVSAPAQAKRKKSARAQAVHLAREGSKAYAAGDYATAKAKFDLAYQTYPATPLVLDLARTGLKLGQCDEAQRYAQIFIGDAGTKGTGANAGQALLDQVHTQCVDVEIVTLPVNALINIPGVPTASPEASTPWKGRIVTGHYKLTVHQVGFAVYTQDLVVEAGKPLHLSLQLTPIPFAEPPPLEPKTIPTISITEGTKPAEPPPAAPATPPPAPAPSPTPQAEAQPPPQLNLTPPPPQPTLPPAATANTPPEGAKPRPQNKAAKAAGWALTAVGAAALVAAVGLNAAGAVNRKGIETLNTSRSGSAAQQQLNQGNTFITPYEALYPVGAVLAVTGVTLVVVF